LGGCFPSCFGGLVALNGIYNEIELGSGLVVDIPLEVFSWCQ